MSALIIRHLTSEGREHRFQVQRLSDGKSADPRILAWLWEALRDPQAGTLAHHCCRGIGDEVAPARPWSLCPAGTQRSAICALTRRGMDRAEVSHGETPIITKGTKEASTPIFAG